MTHQLPFILHNLADDRSDPGNPARYCCSARQQWSREVGLDIGQQIIDGAARRLSRG